MVQETLEEVIQRLGEMEKRLKALEDTEKIKDLHRRYVNAHTFGKTDEELEYYTENATFWIPPREPLKGKTEIAKFARSMPVVSEKVGGVKRIPTDGAFVVHPLITVNGDKATGNWLHYDMHAHPITHQSLFWVQAIYEVEYIKENGEWKINYLKWTPRITPPGGPPYE